MELSEQKIPILNLRVVANQVVYSKGNLFVSIQHTGPGVYIITLLDDTNFDEVNIRCCLFGNPVAPD